PLSNFWANSPFVLPKNEILAESEFAAPTITKLIPIPFSTSGASLAYNVNPVADQFQRAFQTSTFCNRLYSFFNKRWFFDQVLNDFLVRSFLRFGYSVSFEALDKGAIEILGPYGISYTFRRLAERISQLQSGFVVRRVRYDLWPPAWWGPPLWVNGKPDSTNPRKGLVVGALRPELFVVLAGVQVNESHPLASEVLTPLSGAR
ncbi:NADH-ubiquinone oxidoreductase chain 5-like, partial [Impatiens glandulifera]|uniref:NADH-ubiquinone oxidoreductase chain 5-like n=1 Tax=Impatiens glandulifera TaxID=253017 RepID=UPI001FB0EA8F